MKLSELRGYLPTSSRAMTRWGIGMAAVAFVSVNVIAENLLTNARLDLTADQTFTISDGTKKVLAEIAEPVELKFYYSSSLTEAAPMLNSYVRRVSELLEEYQRRSNGMVRITRYDPQPFSEEEDMAVSDGLTGIPLRTDGSVAYFGLSAVNSTDDEDVIPYLSPERASFLEYDLTRLVHDLANPDKPVVGMIGDVPFMGSQMNQFRQMAVLSKIEESFRFKQLTGDFNKIDDDVDVLMIAQPTVLSEEKQYAIDQFALNGGRILAFVDPYAETLAQPGPTGGTLPGISIDTMEPLLTAWGVKVSKDTFVGDADHAMRVRAQVNGRPAAVDYLAWLGIGRENFAADDLITSDLKLLNFNTTGHIKQIEGATTRFEPLVTTSFNTQEIDTAKVQFQPNPAELIAEFEASGITYDLAARISGPVKSAFADKLPDVIEADEDLKEAHINESQADLNLILIADADILADRNWIQQQSLLGTELAIPTANNGDLVVNALENLAGSEGLIALRGKGMTYRPFTVIADMEREAARKFRAKEQELLAEIEETQQKIADLQREEQESGVLLASTQQAEIDDFRTNMLDLRQELRGVQRSLREEVDGLKGWLTAINVWGVPILIGFVATGLAVHNRLRSSKMKHA